MSTLAALAALPAASARRLGPPPLAAGPPARRAADADRWHAQPTPLVGGIGIFLGLSVGVWLAVARRRDAGEHGARRHLPGITVLFVAGLVDDVRALPPLAKLGAQFVAALLVVISGTRVELVHTPVVAWPLAILWLVGMTNAFNLLDNMDGLAGDLAAIAFAFFAIDAVTIHPDHTVLVLALAGAVACSASCRSTCAGAGTHSSSWATPARRCSASRSPRSACSRAGHVADVDRRDAAPAHPRPRRAGPRHDARHDRATARGTAGLPGRPRPQLAPARLASGVSEKHAVLLLALIAIALGGTSLAYNVFGDQRLAARRRARHVRPARAVRSFLADVERAPRRRSTDLLQLFSVHWRRLVEVVVDVG